MLHEKDHQTKNTIKATVHISMAAKGKHYTWEGTCSSKELLSLIQNDKKKSLCQNVKIVLNKKNSSKKKNTLIAWAKVNVQAW